MDQLDRWQVIDTSNEMYEALKKRNITHFGKSELENTPFFQEPLCTGIIYTATSASIEIILERNYTSWSVHS